MKNNRTPVIVSMFDESGNALRPWASAGWECHAFDILNEDTIEAFEGGGVIFFHKADLIDAAQLDYIVNLNPAFVMGWPPCTDLAVSGAAHFEAKRQKNPDFQIEATRLALSVEYVGNRVGCPWFAENPVSVLATTWRKPDGSFHPFEYGGYLPENDTHPRWPEYIKPRDAYTKKTCIWSGNGFKLPAKKPVEVEAGYSLQHRKLGGKSFKTKQIRSEGPRGFLQAVFETQSQEVSLAAFLAA